MAEEDACTGPTGLREAKQAAASTLVCLFTTAARASKRACLRRVPRRGRPRAGLGEASERAQRWVHRPRQDGGPTATDEPVPAFGGEDALRVAARGPAGPRADFEAGGPPLHHRHARDAVARGARPERGAHICSRPRFEDDADARVAERRLAALAAAAPTRAAPRAALAPRRRSACSPRPRDKTDDAAAAIRGALRRFGHVRRREMVPARRLLRRRGVGVAENSAGRRRRRRRVVWW